MYGTNFINAGDVNGDGFEDLGVYQYAESDSTHPYDRDTNIKIYYGGQTPSTTPGYQITYPYTEIWNNDIWINPLGDINNDGYDDISIMKHILYPESKQFDILYGGTFDSYRLYTTYTELRWISLKGIGDVNNDGFADMILSTTVNNNNNVSRIVLYYGGTNISNPDSMVICENSAIIGRKNFPVGDVNDDGYNDFIGGTGETGKLYLGGNNITPLWYAELSPYYFGALYTEVGVVYGDLNNDGFDDIIGTDSGIDMGNGGACIWMGRANFNGTVDLEIAPPSSSLYRQFGKSVAAGDYNNDGLCDVAISAPQWLNGQIQVPGKVFIYSGNTDLHDTTVANEDETQIPEANPIMLKIYPNPFNPSTTISFSLPSKSNIRINIYNIKGQLVKTLINETFERGLHRVLWNGDSNIGSLTGSGIYLIKMTANGKTDVKKAMMLK
jgi:hypothetical protein